MSAIIFDTETTGLPERMPPSEDGKRRWLYPPKQTDKYNSARVVQMAWVKVDPSGRCKKQRMFVIRPEGFQVPAESTAIHGIAHDYAVEHGVPFARAAAELVDDLKDGSVLVAHNLRFDLSVMLSEGYRRGMRPLISALYNAPRYDTMWEGRTELGLKKIPKLVELYEYLFNRPCHQIHDALDDARIATKCYRRLVGIQHRRSYLDRLRPRAIIRKPSRLIACL